jgi:hypothetical protein
MPETEPRKRISEVVSDEIARQESERAEEAAYADLPEKFDPSAPGSTFAKRICQRIRQQRLA